MPATAPNPGPGPGRSHQREIDPRALRGLAHPLRVRILDALVAYGPATATMLAGRFGESTASTSYHLRQLAKHEFVEEDPRRGVGRERYWRAVPGGARLNSYDMLASPSTRQAARLVLDEFQRVHANRLEYWLSAGQQSEPREWAMASVNSVSHLRLHPDELKELTEQLGALVDSWRDRVRDRDQADGRAVELQVNAFPLPATEDS